MNMPTSDGTSPAEFGLSVIGTVRGVLGVAWDDLEMAPDGARAEFTVGGPDLKDVRIRRGWLLAEYLADRVDEHARRVASTRMGVVAVRVATTEVRTWIGQTKARLDGRAASDRDSTSAASA